MIQLTEQFLDEIRNTFNRHLVLPEHAAEALPPWILHTYCFGLGIFPHILHCYLQKNGAVKLRHYHSKQALP